MVERHRLLTIGQLARMLGVHSKWLRESADAGELPCVRAGSGYLFDGELVQRILLERAQQIPRSKSTVNKETRRPR